MKTKLIFVMLLAGAAAFAQFSVGVRIGAPPPIRVRAQPRSPGAGYTWVGGYWYPVGHRYTWHEGYWTRRRTAVHAGWHPVMMESSIITATGTAITARLPTTIAGIKTVTKTGTTIAITTTSSISM